MNDKDKPFIESDSQAKLAKLKESARSIEASLLSRRQVVCQLEEVEKKLELLKKEIDSFHYQARQKTNGETTPFLDSPAIEIRQQERKRLTCLKRQLDHELDRSEETSEESIQQLKDESIACLFLLHPAYRIDYDNQKKRIQAYLSLENNWLFIHDFLFALTDRLTIVVQTRFNIKGLGIIRYFLGHNPNLIIERQLLTSAELIETSLPFLQRFIAQCEDASMRAFYEKIERRVKELLPHLTKQWGFSHLDRLVIPAKEQIENDLNAAAKSLNQIKEKRKDLENKLESWLEKF